ncbi:SDR family oxidoreductase [Motilibacter deserti]|uniref:SDR family oxidoreductase n=1 Tax=Motilibacter deserti TaxID=2714956 RepID=A0ABX0H1F8_9ACTN|nr:SDR family oxidoreductase [Motilibacter deserti]NHC15795.1 SDR family oxidoreductase [Motilibacter deserti]
MTLAPSLDGAVALVTGGGRNVGRAIALRLAAEGATVVVNHFRSPQAARDTVAAIEAAGGRAVAIRASVAVEAQRDAMFAEIDERFGRLDVLVNNAAYGALVPDEQVDDKLLDRALDTNLKGSLGCARAAAALMARHGGGSIVNLSTLGGGSLVMANYLACAPAKAAVEALTRYLAVQLAPQGIRVNTAAAGLIESEVIGYFPDAQSMQETVVAATPMGRLGRPEEFAEVVAFLASPRSSWMTGQLVLADGGLSTGAALLSPAPQAAAQPQPEPAAEAAPAPPVEMPAPRRPAQLLERAEQAARTQPASTAPRPVAPEEDEIAVVGMGITVSGANDPEEYWRLLRDGAELFVEVPPDRWENDHFYAPDRAAEDKTYSQRSAFITGFVPHPALAAELSANGGGAQPESTTLWLRHALLQALEGVVTTPEDALGLMVGYTADGSQHLEEAMLRSGVRTRMESVLRSLQVPADERERRLGAVDEALSRSYPRSGPDPMRYLPHQVGAHAMRGVLPADTELLVVDTACSSSLYTVDLGVKGLVDGRYDVAVCGGAFALGPRGSILFAKLNGLSARGEVRSLDAGSDGVLFADGAAVVVLKRLSRARADGDRVLATLRAFGSSSDGKGKAIYAPSPAGQKIAIQRAMAQAGDVPPPEWVVAHATGTPAGDLAEFTTLRETIDSAAPVQVTSNKSVIGHTGWAAGAASLIEVVLALKHGEIPRQHRFTAPPESFQVGSTCLDIPVADVPWPRREDRRTASVSGFGFGGTNAHLVVQDPPAAAAEGTLSVPKRQRLAIVGQAAHVPGGIGAEQLAGLLADGAEPERSFGPSYPLPPFQKVRMPPGILRSIDRCQLMILECAHTLRDRLGDFWEAERRTMGVLLGHMGATRNATLYATRCYLDDLSRRLPADPALAGAEWLDEAMKRLADDVRGLVAPSNEDSFPGMMPNVIPARVANYFDLNGLNMTVDTGFTSALSALDVAARYLLAGDLTVALVGGINGNATVEARELVAPVLSGEAELAEGAFLFAVVTEETARRAGLEVLGLFDPEELQEAAAAGAAPADVTCGAVPSGRTASYLGAEGGLGILQALAATARGERATVVCDGGDVPGRRLVLVPDAEPAADAGPAPDASAAGTAPASAGQQPALPAGTLPDGTPCKVDRHVARLVPDPGDGGGPTTRFWPAGERVVVLTDRPDLVTGVAPPSAFVLSVAPVDPASGAVHIAEVSPDAVAAALGTAPVRHVRVVTTLAASTRQPAYASTGVEALHDLLFCTLQAGYDRLREPGASCVVLALDAVAGDAPAPLAGLFTGLLKVARLELEQSTTYAVLTSAQALSAGVAEAEAESAHTRGLPVAYYLDGCRCTSRLQVDAGEQAELPTLNESSLVLAVGGGRGITAELLAGLARDVRPHIVVVGSNRIDEHPERYLQMPEAEFLSSRSGYMREQLAQGGGVTPAQANARFQRIADARDTVRNLDRLRALCGADRVRYLACDIRDAHEVRGVVEQALAVTGRVDLLINAPGLNRSAPLNVKSFEEFRRIRDLKLRAYQNLKSAFGDVRPGLWCNFGSLLGITGQVGEADYAAANDFLACAATYAHDALGAAETTIAWTLWGEVGLGAGELTKAYFEKTGMYSAMSTAEGVHHFLRELRMARVEPLSVHLGDAERAAVGRLIPGFLSTGPATPATSVQERPEPHFLDREVSRTATSAVFEHGFSVGADPYLAHHLVSGAPTLPGTFVTEIAYEAASALLPDLQVYALEDLVFHRFLKVRPDAAPVPHRVSATVAEVRPDLGQAVVEVRVTSDVVAPNGTVLVRDRLHFTTRVLLARSLPEAPRWEPWPALSETPVVDPYHAAGSPVLLTDMFASTTRTRLHPWGKRSTYDLRLRPDDPVFSRFGVPTILLDGLARTGVLALVQDGLVPLAAPLSIRRVNLYERTNDARIAAEHGTVELYAVLDDAGDAGGAGAGNAFTAVRPDGRVLAELRDLDWTVLGFLRPETGEFLQPDQVPGAGSLSTMAGVR